MKRNYSFLSDNLAVQEIRKHKWIESEKQGREIGFATAAIDWIKKYGQQWQLYRQKLAPAADPFSEKRRYRRFPRRFPLKIEIGQQKIECHTDDINLLGLSCTIPLAVLNNTEANVTIRLPHEGRKRNEEDVHFHTKVARVGTRQARRNQGPFNVYFPFSEEIKDLIRTNTELLRN